MLDPSSIDALVAAGVTTEQLAAVIKAEMAADHEKLLERRVYERNRKRIQRSRPRDIAGQPGTTLPPCPPLDKEKVPTPLKEINPPLNPPTPINLTITEFSEFWEAYPLKTGKKAAWKAFDKARKFAKTPQMLDGLHRYIANKPPDQAFCHASTWLNGHRWEDENPPLVQTTNHISAKPLTPRQQILLNNMEITRALQNGTLKPSAYHPSAERDLGGQEEILRPLGLPAPKDVSPDGKSDYPRIHAGNGSDHGELF